MQSGQPAPPNGVSATPPPPQYTNSGGSYGAPPPGGYYDQYGQPYPAVAAAAAPPVPGATAGLYGHPTGAPQYAPSPVAYNQSPYYAPPYPQYAPAPPPPQQPYYYQPAPPPSAAAPPAQGGYYGSATSATSQSHSAEYGTPYVYAPQTAAGTAAAAAPPTPQHMHHMQQAQQGYMQPGQGYAPYGGQPQAQQMYAPQVYQTQPPQQQLHSAGMPYTMYPVQGSMGPAAAAAQAFARADDRNKGQLDVKGFKMALECLGVNINYDQLLKYFAMADRDRDGNIAETEFISLYQNEIYRV